MNDLPIPHPAFSTPMALLDRAVAAGASMEMIEKLMALVERRETWEARKAYDRAKADARAKMPVIAKNRSVDYTPKSGGRVKYAYEDLAEVCRTIDPIIAEFGLDYSWKEEIQGERITCTCTVAHRDGHREHFSFSGGFDKSGNKNDIQSASSATTYLRRITLKGAFGLSSAEDDDDGRAAGAAGPATITPEQVAQIGALLGELEDDRALAKILNFAKVGELAEIQASDLPVVFDWLRKKKTREVEAAAAQGEGS